MFRVSILFLLATSLCTRAAAPGYAVVAPAAYRADADWEAVVETLREKHGARVIRYDKSPREALPALTDLHPRHACFVLRPQDASREAVAEIARLCREFDADPYTDCLWGILTGFDAANARAIAARREPLTVRRVAGGTEFAMDMVEAGVWYDELKALKSVVKKPGEEKASLVIAPADTTQSLVESLNDYQPDLFITSGHATERDWQIGYTYRNGYFKCSPGQLYGEDTQGQKHPIHSSNPKVYLPIGNCLMGHIDSQKAMALAWMNSAGVHQMIGYTVPTWYGYAGWGVLDYFVEQPGRYTLAEAFHGNLNSLVWKLSLFGEKALAATDPAKPISVEVTDAWRAEGLATKDARGLVHDREVVALYGDPAWEARMADRPKYYDQELVEKDGVWTFTVTPRQGERSFEPVNRNGAQRGHRPIFAWLPKRVGSATVVEGQDLKPVITDDFLLIPNPRTCDPARVYKVVFNAAPIVPKSS